MPEVLINNTKVTIKDEAKTVQELMNFILDSIVDPEQVVTDLRIDDRSLSFDEESTIMSRPITAFEKINFQTQGAYELAVDSLDSCVEYIDVISNNVKELISAYRENDQTQANMMFGESMETINLFIELFTRINQTLSKKSDASQKPETLHRIEMHLLATLKALLPAREKNDTIMLCDLLEYELLDNLDEWKNKAIPEIKKMHQA